ncbi:ATP-binding protein, partial [Actinoplanes sp. NPDC048791]|uniref:ATP-binding protein n=1 Tax=Actinoplanes sp. NPDC048791 TaxID=3154623 RepID=UPI0033FDAC80
MSQDPLRYFRVEARELIDQISAGVLDLDQQPGPDLVARLLRFAHTLKGAARVVRQQEIADRAHAFEEVLVPHRSAGEPLPADQMRELLRLNDEIEERVAALEPQRPQAQPPLRFPPGMTPGGASPSPGLRASGDRGAGPGRAAEQEDESRTGNARLPESEPGSLGAQQHDGDPGRPVGGRADDTAAHSGPQAEEVVGATSASQHDDERRIQVPGVHGRQHQQSDQPQGAAPQTDSGREDVDRSEINRRQTAYPSAAGDMGGIATAAASAAQPAPVDGPDDHRPKAGDGTRHSEQGRSAADVPGGAEATAKSEEAAKTPSHPDAAPAARGATADVDELLDAVGEAHARFAPLRTGGHALDQLTRSAEALADQLRVGRTAAHTDAARVVAARLAADLGALGRRITDTVEQVERELDEVRGRAERLRLVSASSIFTGLHRAVRDAADAQGKRVRFEGRGGDLRLDPQVLTLANNALLHVVRNSVAHGIEPDADRLAAGKPVEGRVVVEVERRGRYVAFRCTDDGRGFDLAAVRRTAEARGLLMPGGTPPDEQTLVELVLRGGISTSPTVTEVAGRGIGLDVARDVADQLGGEVSVRTEAGRGAAVELVLPLALMSMHGLILEAAGTIATVPLDSVRTCVRLLPEQATAAAVTGKMAHDGEAVPFLPLARALYAGTTVPDGGGPTVAVIVGTDDQAVAVGVDRL